MNKNISAIVLIVIAVGIYFTVTDPMLTGIKSVQAVNDQYVSALTHAEKLIATRDAVLKQYNDISQDDRARIDKMIPSSVDNIRLTIDLNSRALQHGFSLTGVKATASSNGSKNGVGGVPAASSGSGSSVGSLSAPTLDTVTVSFSANASFDQFMAFLQDLESDLRVMDLTHLTMSYGTDNLYNFNAQFQTYWLRQ